MPGAFAHSTERGVQLAPCGRLIGRQLTYTRAEAQVRAAWDLHAHLARCGDCRSWLQRHWPSLLAVIQSWRRA